MHNTSIPSAYVGRGLLLSACVLEIVLGTALAWTHLPLCDEGFYGVPAHALSTSGVLRNPVLESAGIKYLRGVDQKFYWMAPMGMVLQGLAFFVFGFGLLIQRELSVVFGLGVVLCWYLTMRQLVPDRVAGMAALFLSADFVFLSLSSLGRSDVISLFFSITALAAYMNLRQRSLALALAVSHTSGALSGVVHPNGGIAAVLSLVMLMFFLDRARLTWKHFAMIGTCYAVVGLGWVLYAATAPDLFAAQFLGNVANRFTERMTFPRLFTRELARYAAAYGLQQAHGIKLALYLVPVGYLSAIAFCALSKHLRAQQGVLLLLCMFVGISLSLVFLEGSKQGWYLVHLSPVFCGLLAIFVDRIWQSGRILERVAAAAQISIIALGMARLCYDASRQHLQRLYQPATAYLNGHLGPHDLVFARSEFYFGLRCRTCLRDDPNLGAFSGRRADFIVIDPDYSEYLAGLMQTSAPTYEVIQNTLSSEYRQVFRNDTYEILQRLNR